MNETLTANNHHETAHNTSLLNSLNEDQEKVVTTTEGYVRVIAGAGSGKTRTLTARYEYLVNNVGISTANILCVTFTNKAANEMKWRIRKYMGDKDLALICTFHGFCNYFLHHEIQRIAWPKNFRILDTEDARDILKRVYAEYRLNARTITINKMLGYIESRKAEDSAYLDFMTASDDKVLRNKLYSAIEMRDIAFYAYLYEQRKSYGLDFTDLINLTLYILQENSDIRLRWQKRLEYIMVDEFQDVNSNQYHLCTLLSKYHENLFIVGDPDQTIYSWRGANVKFILDFNKEFPSAQTIVLDTNYRSTPEILNASNSLIEKNVNRYKKELHSLRKPGETVVYNHTKTASDEAAWIAESINKLHMEKGVDLRDIAILYRAHHVSRSIEEALSRANIPYQIYSGIRFYERKEIKDTLSYLRMLQEKDDISFLRTINTPKRGIGKKRIAFLLNKQKETGESLYSILKGSMKSPLFKGTKACKYVELIETLTKKTGELSLSDLFKTVLIETGYEAMIRNEGDEERLENLSELASSIYDYEITANEAIDLNNYLNEVALLTNTDKNAKQQYVSLMTMHAAKGLEFPVVFTCCMIDGVIPSRNCLTQEALEEERRIAYVAMTRAKDLLFISDFEGPKSDVSFSFPSRFIFDIDKNTLRYNQELDEQFIQRAKESYFYTDVNPVKVEQNYHTGDFVKHEIFGIGEITSINDEGYLEVNFIALGKTRHLAPSAKQLNRISSDWLIEAAKAAKPKSENNSNSNNAS